MAPKLRRRKRSAATTQDPGHGAGEEGEAEAEPLEPKPKARRASSAAASTELCEAPLEAAAGAAEEGEDSEEESSEEEVHDAEREGSDEEGAGEDDDDDGEGEGAQKHIWRPGIDALEEGEQLDVEPGTYDMLHRGQVEWPCLSFDVVRDDLGARRTAYPMTAYVVAGTQAEQSADNRIFMMKWSSLHRTVKDGADDSDDDDDSDDEEDNREAVLECKGVPHPGGVNRIRSMPQAGHIVATWSDQGNVHMWNLQSQRMALDKPREKPVANPKPIFTSNAHGEEGFALDFSPHTTGHFLSGSGSGRILHWEPVAGGWKVGAEQPFHGHAASVEDVQWKRTGNGTPHTFASCSVDCTVRVWDVREKDRKKSAVRIADAHDADVNVLSWSPCVGELLVSGSDDGSFKVWDTRNVAVGPMANFRWHRKPITSVDWHPTDETVLAVASADDCVSLWDMAVEDDAEGREAAPGADHFPPQLLFLHQGQREPKELKWHPQLPSVCITTALSGFNIFKTCNI